MGFMSDFLVSTKWVINSKPMTTLLVMNGAACPITSHILPDTIGPTTIPDPCRVKKNPHTAPLSPLGTKCDIKVFHAGRINA